MEWGLCEQSINVIIRKRILQMMAGYYVKGFAPKRFML